MNYSLNSSRLSRVAGGVGLLSSHAVAGIFIRANTAFRMILRGGVCVQACHAAVCVEFAFGRLGVISTQAS